MNDIQVPNAVRRNIVEQKIQMWRNTIYDAELDAKVAKALGSKADEKQAEKRMKDALKAVDVLKGLLDDIPKEEVIDGTKFESD